MSFFWTPHQEQIFHLQVHHKIKGKKEKIFLNQTNNLNQNMNQRKKINRISMRVKNKQKGSSGIFPNLLIYFKEFLSS